MIHGTDERVDPASIDWREAMMRALDAIGYCEGVIFEDAWGLPAPVVMTIIDELDRWQAEHKGRCCGDGPTWGGPAG